MVRGHSAWSDAVFGAFMSVFGAPDAAARDGAKDEASREPDG
jgi:hypothetical protein